MGANMLTGVVNALALRINPFSKIDYSVLESDEAYLEKIYDKFDADYLLVTNLFRDQLDRYGELATTKNLIQKGIDKKPNIQLILNSDDPLVASFVSQNKQPIYYGVNSVIGLEAVQSKAEENFNCPICGKSLKYSQKFFAQQGHYYCDCGYKRVEPKYSADIVLHKTHSVLNINGEEYTVPLVGLFNAYNALGAISLALELGIKDIKSNLTSFKVAFGRSEIKYLNGKRTLIQLIKNPIGANEVLKTVDLDSNILIVINDNYADGRDVSWLWDAEFELIKNAKHEIVVSGSRANDMALRLKYAGVTNIKIIPEINKSIDYIGNSAEQEITILPTYTSLLQINKNKKLVK
jgi:UDP-N-acetylmuramyl tripeptide synthase